MLARRFGRSAAGDRPKRLHACGDDRHVSPRYPIERRVTKTLPSIWPDRTSVLPQRAQKGGDAATLLSMRRHFKGMAAFARVAQRIHAIADVLRAASQETADDRGAWGRVGRMSAPGEDWTIGAG